MGQVDFDSAMLVLAGWRDDGALVSVIGNSGAVSIRASLSIAELTGGGMRLESASEEVQLILDFADDSISFWYAEPREFSGKDAEFVALLSDDEKIASGIGISLSTGKLVLCRFPV